MGLGWAGGEVDFHLGIVLGRQAQLSILSRLTGSFHV